MDHKLIWMLKSSQITNTAKNLTELSVSKNLYTENGIKEDSPKFNAVIESYEKAKRNGCTIVAYTDDLYPESMRQLALPPPFFFVRGNADILRHPVYAGIVGSRKCDFYGLQTSRHIAEDIAETGAGIVSGGAEGVDAAAHMGAINAGAPTIAVFGSGLDVPYPSCNLQLFKKITASGGAIISEFLFGEAPQKHNFPYRNRIIAALSNIVIVVQAGARSGSLITASHADKLGKSIFSVPGNIDNPLSAGTNGLIRDGVSPLTSSMDAIDELILKYPDFFALPKKTNPDEPAAESYKAIKENTENLSNFEKELLTLVKNGKCTESELEECISFDASRLAGILGLLELKGVLKKGFDKKYKIVCGGKY